MKFKRTVREELVINITPLIDVVFLLLIFFMVTTTFSRETRLLVNLPEANANVVEADQEQIEIIVSVDGTYTVNGKGLVNTQPETLARALEIEANVDLGLPVLLVADALASHQSVVTAMDVIGKSGFTRLRIATARPGDDSGSGVIN